MPGLGYTTLCHHLKHTIMTQRISIAIAFLTGLGMIFIGARFLLAPETAEVGYGIHFNEHVDYSFHYIKGIRDVFSGLVICLFVLTKQTKALVLHWRQEPLFLLPIC